MIDQLKPSSPQTDSTSSARGDPRGSGGFDAAMMAALLGGDTADSGAELATQASTESSDPEPPAPDAPEAAAKDRVPTAVAGLPGFAEQTGTPPSALSLLVSASTPHPGASAIGDAASEAASGEAPTSEADDAAPGTGPGSPTAPGAAPAALPGQTAPIAASTAVANATAANATATHATAANAAAANAATANAASDESSALPGMPGAATVALAADGRGEGQARDAELARSPRAQRVNPGAKAASRSHAAASLGSAASAASATSAASEASAATDGSTAIVASAYDIRDTLEFAARRGGGDATAVAANPALFAHAAGANGSSPLHTPVAAVPTQLAVAAPLQSAQFAPAISAQIATIAMQGIRSAEITLNPKELGPVKVSLTLSGETMEIAFAAAQPETRQAIEQSLPLLRSMLSEQGLNLSHATVGQGGFGQPQDRRDAQDPAAAGTDTRGGTRADSRRQGDADTPASASRRGGNGLVDLFA